MKDGDSAVALQDAFIRSLGEVTWIHPQIDFEAELPKGERIAIEDWQKSLIQMRTNSLQNPGIYLDASPTGAGKSTADQAALRKVNSALIVLPTHEQCQELENELRVAGFDAVAFRGRFSQGEDQNCWNDDADDAEKMGLSVTAAVCPWCDYRADCLMKGYLAATEEARLASVAIATHSRATHNGFESLAADRQYLAVHEDVIKVLLPIMELIPESLNATSVMLNQLLSDPRWLNYFGDSHKIDHSGQRISDDRKLARRNAQHEFVLALVQLVEALIESIDTSTVTESIVLPETCRKPAGIEQVLFNISRECKSVVGRMTPWPALLSIISGDVFRLAVVVGEYKGRVFKYLSAVRRNLPPLKIATWLADATADAGALQHAIEHVVSDKTPAGHLALACNVEQHVVDVTRTASNARVQNLIRGILVDRPHCWRVGVICHKPHVAAVKAMGTLFDGRICRVAYFGSGQDRALNSWHEECDLLIVLGTPRLPPKAIQSWLVRIGMPEAANGDGDWGPLRWQGVTKSGQRRIVDGRGYRDSDWQQAQNANVRASIVQAVGRGRGFRKSGCDVVLLSNEEAGFPLCSPENTVDELSESETSILATLIGAGSCKTLLGSSAYVSTKEIATSIGLEPRQTRELLTQLELRSFVQRKGERGGWTLSERGAQLAPDEFDESTKKETIHEERMTILPDNQR